MSQWKPSVCPRDCPDTCGLLVKVEGDRVQAVRGDPEHPFTRGVICRKARLYPRRVHSPQRLREPLLRDGPKGSGRFRPVSWDQAMELMQARLEETIERFGPQAVLPYYYAGHMGLVHRRAGDAFFHRLGASRLWLTICSGAATAGFAASLGKGPTTDIETTPKNDLIIIWGSNTLATNLHAWPFFQEARRRGARLVVIDPYRNATAAKADRHLKLKPGSDAALALSLMQQLIEHDLLDHDFIARHTVGFDRLKERAAQYPPERAAGLCGLEPREIEELAQDYGRARAPYIRTGWGPARQLNGGMALRTIALLPALVGALGRGNGGITRSTSAFPLDTDFLSRPDLCPPGTRLINMVRLGEALTRLEDPPIKYLQVYLSNPAVVAPDSSQVLAGLAREDLFTVVQEMFLTDTARYADLVLPSTSFLEMTDLYTAYGHYYLQMARPVIPPQGRCRSILSVFQDLAARMGFSEEVFSLDEEQIIRRLLAVDSPFLEGIDFEQVARCRPIRVRVPQNPFSLGFNTPSGKVEFYSQALAEQGLDPLPVGEPLVDPPGQGRYPLHLITPPRAEFLNSTFNELDELHRQAGPPTVLIHHRDAAARGIAEGDRVRLFNDRGHCFLQAQVTNDTSPGVLVAEGLYWAGRMPGGRSINQLTSQAETDLGGSCAFHGSLVELEPAGEVQER